MLPRSTDNHSLSEDEDYVEINAAVKRSLQHHQFKAGDLMAQMLDRGKYGPYASFKDYVVTELRISEVTAHRLIFAHKMEVLLKKNHCQRPLNERQVRPLNILKESRLQVLAWDRACNMKQKGNPTFSDVQREVNRINIPKRDETIDERARRYRAHLEAMWTELSKATRELEDGELEEFLGRYDKRSQRYQQAIANRIVKLGIRLVDHYNKFSVFLKNPPQNEKDLHPMRHDPDVLAAEADH